MKKAILIWGCICSLFLTACGEENNDWITPADENTTQAVRNGIEIPAQGSNFSLGFNHSGTTCRAVTAGLYPYWKYCEMTSVSDDNQTYFNFDFPAYEGFADMDMTISFEAGNSNTVVRLKQLAPLHADVNQESWAVPAEGDILNIKGQTNVEFQVIIPEAGKDWIHCDDIKKGYYQDMTIVLRVDANHSGASRSCQLQLETVYGVTTGEIMISQK